MFADEVFKFKVVDRGFALADYLVEHPNLVVRFFERGDYTYFRYDPELDRFLYRRPSNKRNNRWQIAYGLESFFFSRFEYTEEL